MQFAHGAAGRGLPGIESMWHAESSVQAYGLTGCVNSWVLCLLGHVAAQAGPRQCQDPAESAQSLSKDGQSAMMIMCPCSKLSPTATAAAHLRDDLCGDIHSSVLLHGLRICVWQGGAVVPLLHALILCSTSSGLSSGPAMGSCMLLGQALRVSAALLYRLSSHWCGQEPKVWQGRCGAGALQAPGA